MKLLKKLFSAFARSQLKTPVKKKKEALIERVPLSSNPIRVEDIEPREEVSYYTTENSEFAREAPKTTARGIDKFDENKVLR
jgi:hypothetical protein